MSVDDLFLLIFEKVLTFISGLLDVFRMLSRYDNRIPCIAPCKSKMPFAHIIGTEIQEVLGTGEERGYTERCNGRDMGERTPACSGGTAAHLNRRALLRPPFPVSRFTLIFLCVRLLLRIYSCSTCIGVS
jgi:hypothetical protein